MARIEPNFLFQTPTFAEFNLPAGDNDEKILDALSVDACADSVEMEARIELLKRLKKTAAEVVKGLDGQAIQFENSRKLYAVRFAESGNAEYQEKYRQAGDALQDLHDQISVAINLQRRLGEMIRAGEKAKDEARRKEFAARLKKLRLAAGLKQVDLALIIGLSPTGYANYEQGKADPSIPILIRICHALNCSADKILGI